MLLTNERQNTNADKKEITLGQSPLCLTCYKKNLVIRKPWSSQTLGFPQEPLDFQKAHRSYCLSNN